MGGESSGKPAKIFFHDGFFQECFFGQSQVQVIFAF